MSLTISITDRVAPNYQKTTGITGGAALQYAPTLSSTVSYASGTAAGQVDLLYSATRTITASSNEDLDLAGVLTDVFGAVLTFVKVRYIYIKPSSGNANQVVIGAAAATQFVGPFGAATHTLSLSPGFPYHFFAPSAGWSVAAGSTDLFRVTNGGAGTSVTYDILIAGTSA